MAITLSPETEARLRERAAQDGQDTDMHANTLLTTVLTEEADEERAKQDAYHAALLASGLVKRIARRSEPDTSERRLIQVQGEPVSETILRERR